MPQASPPIGHARILLQDNAGVKGSPIIEVKRTLDGREIEFGCDAALVEPGRRAILIYVLDAHREVPGVALHPGMRTYGHFWMDRPFNVYHWLDDGRTVGHYFNIGECSEINAERVVWNDYVVDIVVTPDGRAQVLDEDELPADVNLATRELVAATRDRILRDIVALTREVEAETRRYLG